MESFSGGAGGGASKKSSMWRLIAGVGSAISLVFFLGAWAGTIITSGFSLTNVHTYAGWLYFPLFWPHFAAATLGFMLFIRYGANWITALLGLALWLVAIISDLYGTILYWRLGWLCNISGLGSVTTVEAEICANEDPLLISLWVVSTLVLIAAIVTAIAQAFDLVKAAKSGKSAPKVQLSAPVMIMLPFGILSALIFFAFWIMNVLTSGESLIGRQAFAVWAHINIFSMQIPATILSLMLGVRYGANWATAIAAPILWGISFFAAFFGTGLYWQLGWFCQVASGSPMTGVDLEICNNEENWLTAVWVMVSVLGLSTITNFIAHINDIGSASAQGQSLNPLRGFYRPGKGKRGKGSTTDPSYELGDLEGPGDATPLEEGKETQPLMLEGGAGNGDARQRFFNSAAAAGRYIGSGGVNSRDLNQFIGAVVPSSRNHDQHHHHHQQQQQQQQQQQHHHHQQLQRGGGPPEIALPAARPSAAGQYLASRRASIATAPSTPQKATLAKALPAPPLTTSMGTEGLRRKRVVHDGSPTLG